MIRFLGVSVFVGSQIAAEPLDSIDEDYCVENVFHEGDSHCQGSVSVRASTSDAHHMCLANSVVELIASAADKFVDVRCRQLGLVDRILSQVSHGDGFGNMSNKSWRNLQIVHESMCGAQLSVEVRHVQMNGCCIVSRAGEGVAIGTILADWRRGHAWCQVDALDRHTNWDVNISEAKSIVSIREKWWVGADADADVPAPKRPRVQCECALTLLVSGASNINVLDKDGEWQCPVASEGGRCPMADSDYVTASSDEDSVGDPPQERPDVLPAPPSVSCDELPMQQHLALPSVLLEEIDTLGVNNSSMQQHLALPSVLLEEIGTLGVNNSSETEQGDDFQDHRQHDVNHRGRHNDVPCFAEDLSETEQAGAAHNHGQDNVNDRPCNNYVSCFAEVAHDDATSGQGGIGDSQSMQSADSAEDGSRLVETDFHCRCGQPLVCGQDVRRFVASSGHL